MDFSRALVAVMLAVVCLLHQSYGHYNKDRMYRGGLYSPSRYPGYHTGRPGGLGNTFRNTYRYYKNKADSGNMGNTVSGGRPRTTRVVIRLPSSLVNDPNFKMSDLPFYLSSGLFDPNNLPGPLGSPSLPRRIVDPLNPSGVLVNNNDLNDLNQILGVRTNIFGGANTNLLSGANTNLLGGANTNLLGGTSLLGGANTNLLGGTSLLGGANTNLLGGTSLLGGANTNLLGGTSLLGGANTNLLGGTSLLGGANTNLLGGTSLLGGANTNFLAGAGNTGLVNGGNTGLVNGGNTDFYNTKTGTSSDLLSSALNG